MERHTANNWVHFDDDTKSLLIGLNGNDFGPNPDQRIAEIKESRRGFANHIADQTRVTARDTVLDLGSGCGFGTSRLAERAAWIHACDVSPAYLKFAKQTCADKSNISYHLIEPHKLTCIPDQSIDVAISMSVFIHFNLYDIYWYFHELKRVVKAGGRLWFDVADADAIRPDITNWQTEHFLNQTKHYLEQPSNISGLMQWNSLQAVIQLARAYGFENQQKNEWGQMLFLKHA